MHTSQSRGHRSLTQRSVAAAVGGLAVTAGLGLGGLAVADAQDTTAPTKSATSQSTGGPADGQHGNHLATLLADALGKDAETVQQALDEIRDERRTSAPDTGGTRPATPPSEADRTAHDQELAASLAEKLGVDEGEITDAIAATHATQGQERAAAVTTRLDDAVAAGTLTEADAASVLKAIDAGVINAGGPNGHDGPRGPGGPRGAGGHAAPGDATES